MVSNPVDPLTYFFQQEASWPKNQIMGIASSLDSARFRSLLAKEFEVAQSEISDAMVLGAHDDTMVPIFSHAKNKGTIVSSWPQNQIMGIASSLDSSRFRSLLAKEFGVPQSEILDAMVLGAHDDTMVPIFSHAKNKGTPILNLLNESQVKKITHDLLDYWKVLRNLKDPSLFGIAKNTYDVISSIIKNNKISIPASVLLNGQYGLSDVCLGVPITVNQKGVNEILEIDLNENEIKSLHNSASTVKKFI